MLMMMPRSPRTPHRLLHKRKILVREKVGAGAEWVGGRVLGGVGQAHWTLVIYLVALTSWHPPGTHPAPTSFDLERPTAPTRHPPQNQVFQCLCRQNEGALDAMLGLWVNSPDGRGFTHLLGVAQELQTRLGPRLFKESAPCRYWLTPQVTQKPCKASFQQSIQCLNSFGEISPETVTEA